MRPNLELPALWRRRGAVLTALLAVIVGTHALPAAAGAAAPAPPLAATTAVAADAATAAGPVHDQRFDYWFWIDQAREKLLDLANAEPEAGYTYRPADTVRHFGEVLMHVASANYGVAELWGTKTPAGIDRNSFEKDYTNKAKVIATLTASFEHLHNAIFAVSEADLQRTITIFDHQGTIREAMVIALMHPHEHLGQLIAYTRATGIVPLWNLPDANTPPPAKPDAKPSGHR